MIENQFLVTPYKKMSSGRFLSALPDAILCIYFIAIYNDPSAFSKETIKNFGLIFLLELFVLQYHLATIGTILNPEISLNTEISKLFKPLIIVLLPFVVIALASKGWWPILVFAWLVISRFGTLILNRLPDEEERQRQLDQYIAGGILYIFCFICGGLLKEWTSMDIALTMAGMFYFGISSFFILFNAYRAIIYIVILSCIIMGVWFVYWQSFIRYS